jgi:hypothetical protein
MYVREEINPRVSQTASRKVHLRLFGPTSDYVFDEQRLQFGGLEIRLAPVMM